MTEVTDVTNVNLESAMQDWLPDSGTKVEEAAAAEAEAAVEAVETAGAAGAAEASANIEAEPTQAEAEPAAPVTFVSDPFGLPVLDVADAQNQTEEDLDDEGEDELQADEVQADDLPDTDLELAADDGTLDRVAASMAEEDKRLESELEEITKQLQNEAEKQLQNEIAEDQALAEREAELAQLDPELLAALPKQPVPAEDGSLDLAEMESCIETILFISDKPLSAAKLRELLGPDFPLSLFQEAITSLRDRYQANNHGIELAEIGGGFQFRTKPGRAALAKKLAKVQAQRLSSGAMQTLAIVAYKQPVLKEDVDKIRGVDSSYFVRGLLEKRLIRISGRSDLPGRPMVYGTTPEFLELFGLKDLAAMPPLRELEQMVPGSEAKNAADDDPRIKEMRRLVGEMKMDASALHYDPKEDDKILREIRERVQSIPSSTPYIDEQKRLEKEAAEAAAAAAKAATEGTVVFTEGAVVAAPAKDLFEAAGAGAGVGTGVGAASTVAAATAASGAAAESPQTFVVADSPAAEAALNVDAAVQSEEAPAVDAAAIAGSAEQAEMNPQA